MPQDPLKKAKEFLRNIMTINSCKEKIQNVMSRYQEDDVIRKPDLEILIENMTTIITCNKKNNTPCQMDEDCLEELKGSVDKLTANNN